MALHLTPHLPLQVTQQDLVDSYLLPFQACVEKGKVTSLMCSYNAINGVPTCCDADLNSLLRDTWGFDGYITSDSGAIADIYGAHHFQKMSAEQAAAAA